MGFRVKLIFKNAQRDTDMKI